MAHYPNSFGTRWRQVLGFIFIRKPYSTTKHPAETTVIDNGVTDIENEQYENINTSKEMTGGQGTEVEAITLSLRVDAVAAICLSRK